MKWLVGFFLVCGVCSSSAWATVDRPSFREIDEFYDLSLGAGKSMNVRVVHRYRGEARRDIEYILDVESADDPKTLDILLEYDKYTKPLILTEPASIIDKSKAGGLGVSFAFHAGDPWFLKKEKEDWWRICLYRTALQSALKNPKDYENQIALGEPLVNTPFSLKQNTTITLPAERKKWGFQDEKKVIDNPFYSLNYEKKYDDGVLSYHYSFFTKKNVITPEEMGAYRVAWKQFCDVACHLKLSYTRPSWGNKLGIVLKKLGPLLVLFCFLGVLVWVVLAWRFSKRCMTLFRGKKAYSEEVLIQTIPSLTLTYRIDAPIEKVWDNLIKFKGWPNDNRIQWVEEGEGSPIAERKMHPWKKEHFKDGAMIHEEFRFYGGLFKLVQDSTIQDINAPHGFTLVAKKQSPYTSKSRQHILTEAITNFQLRETDGQTEIEFTISASYEHPVDYKLPLDGAKRRLSRHYRGYARQLAKQCKRDRG